MAEVKKSRKTFIGNVLKGKMDKTVVVGVERLTKHPLYGKYMKKRVKYTAHDEKNECGFGDKVMIVETRPLSKMKRWRVKEILEKAK
ncbi:MAG: 30S ribosomal protein S17 [Thermodesulfobacteriota bacterium]|nr:MAG: 30S ribosomal protein S17 [Thermodesulfobacteriota bacterium]